MHRAFHPEEEQVLKGTSSIQEGTERSDPIKTHKWQKRQNRETGTPPPAQQPEQARGRVWLGQPGMDPCPDAQEKALQVKVQLDHK